MATLALVYDNAADAEGKLSKSETKTLLQTQFTHFMQVRWSVLKGIYTLLFHPA